MDENKVDFEKMTPAERLKYEVAEEIGWQTRYGSMAGEA